MNTRYILANSSYLYTFLQKSRGYLRVEVQDTRQHGWVECLVYKSASAKPAFMLLPSVELFRREGRSYVRCERATF